MSRIIDIGELNFVLRIYTMAGPVEVYAQTHSVALSTATALWRDGTLGGQGIYKIQVWNKSEDRKLNELI